MRTKMMPCPFCFHTDLLFVEFHPENQFLTVRCWKCGCIGPSKTSETEEEAIAHWNSRKSCTGTTTMASLSPTHNGDR